MRSRRSVTAISLAVIVVGALATVPAAAQDPTYDAALESGDLTMLIPEPFADAELMTGMTFETGLGPPQVDTPEAAAAREELLAIVDAAGQTPGEVTSIAGFVEVEGAFTTFGAIRIPGVAAGDWFEPYYRVALVRSYRDPVRELVAVGPKQVLRIFDRGSDRSDLLYAQGEVLWSLAGDDDLGVAFLEGLATIEGPALRVDPGAPGDGDPVTVIGTPDDPLSQIPPEILDAATATQTFPASAIVDRIDPNDPEAVALADAFRAMFDGIGGIERATIISSQAVGDDGGIIILGLHVDGADQAAFRDGFVDLFLVSELDAPQLEETQLGGKAVTRVSDADALSGDVAYVYGVGGTAWILRGQEEYITSLLRTMP